MPRRDDIKSVLIIGAGPIIIGQACEFDYSGAQACKALKEEGYRVILVNSNPATIMTDPGMADATYIEPIIWESVAKIIEIERPDALLPTMGGQTALNCALDLVSQGVLERYGVEMIGASREAIDKAEDRELFRQAMEAINLETARGAIVHNMEEAEQILAMVGFPAIIRPSFTMGGTGGGIAYNREEYFELCERGFDASPTSELLIEESILGWKEFEMEVVRDHADNVIIVCSIENFDPMGVHTGDSITVAPAQTLTDKEYQLMRDASIAVLREIGVDTGGSNVQYAINPDDGRMIVIEMNPRVSRSSALASKATGFPIAKVAAKLAVGYTLDELQNEITGGAMPASFEPSIDYVVTKFPRFDFEKFPAANSVLTTQMKSVGEVMAIGRTFQESLQKALRGLEIGTDGFDEICTETEAGELKETLYRELRVPGCYRIWYLAEALRAGMLLDEIHELTRIDMWFLHQIEQLVLMEQEIRGLDKKSLQAHQIRTWKRKGFSDLRLARLLSINEHEFRAIRHSHDIRPVYKRVDTCAAEFATATAYLYSTYEEECESNPDSSNKIMVLGGGPNRIGQGIEFDYCCVHAAQVCREDGYQTIMVNCNPETVSTDFDTSDRLYFEPLTLEDVLEIIHIENPAGVIVQYGGQTRSREEALVGADEIGFPLVVRPSYVLGGRAMEIVHNIEDLDNYMTVAIQVSNDSPVLLDRFLNDAIEVDLDAVCDGKDVIIGGIMEHIEEAGVHSGDSSCSLPPFSLPENIIQQLREQATSLALAIGVRGLMNIQFAVKGEDIFLLEVNPRASRTVPFVSKATSRPLAKIGARCMTGISLADQGITGEIIPEYYSVKEAVFPFIKFPGVDPVLGPEMKSTGEVMGVGKTFGEAFDKAQKAAGADIPEYGKAFISVRDIDQPRVVEVARYLAGHGFEILATRGTAKVLEAAGVKVRQVNKVREGRPHIVDMIKNDEIDIVINTTEGKRSLRDSYTIRREALLHKVTNFTTLAAAKAAVEAHRASSEITVYKLQDLHKTLK
jgi:carbamoyl-phosphate synthase large subunit